MSKRSRNTDNSKRQQPIQQQRAQARQPNASGPANDTQAGQQPVKGKGKGKEKGGSEGQ